MVCTFEDMKYQGWLLDAVQHYNIRKAWVWMYTADHVCSWIINAEIHCYYAWLSSPQFLSRQNRQAWEFIVYVQDLLLFKTTNKSFTSHFKTTMNSTNNNFRIDFWKGFYSNVCITFCVILTSFKHLQWLLPLPPQVQYWWMSELAVKDCYFF